VFTPGDWTVTPFVGLGFSGNLDSGTGALGAAAGYVWTERVSVEGELNVLPSSEASGLIEVGTHSWTLTANALYHFSGRTWVPYGVFGIGFGHAGADVTGTGVNGAWTLNSSSTEFVANLGGGVERRLNDRMGIPRRSALSIRRQLCS
jgi:outer membrane protein with beta-barrel domain